MKINQTRHYIKLKNRYNLSYTQKLMLIEFTERSSFEKYQFTNLQSLYEILPSKLYTLHESFRDIDFYRLCYIICEYPAVKRKH